MTVVTLLKVSNLMEAKELLKQIGVESPVAQDIMAPKMIHLLLKLSDIAPIPANIIKQEMLAAGGDAAVSHGTLNLSVEKTDVLIMGTYEQINRALSRLRLQPFGMKRICAEIEGALIEQGLEPIREG